jgi:anti-sigma factor RsiW
MNTINPTCHDFAALLSLFAAGELDARQSANVAAHLSACAECRQKVAEYEQLSAHLTKLAPPTLPEDFFDDFHAGVKKKITSIEGAQQQQQQMAGWLVMVHALYRRRRLVIAIATLLLLLLIPTWVTHDRRIIAPPQSNVVQLLVQRDWMGLYYAMRRSVLGALLLNDQVPVELVHTALAEVL